MTQKIILLVTLLYYSIIVSQSFMYILALKQVQLTLDGTAYTEIRKLIDTSMRSNFKYAVYGALIANLILVIITAKNPGSLIFLMAFLAFVALVADTLLTIKGNLPVNDIINSWSAQNIPDNWKDIRGRWFQVYQYRQLANITGFICLAIGVIFGK